MTTYIVDYAKLDEDDYETDEVITEHVEGKEKAERRARYLSKKFHRGGYDGLSVYVYRLINPTGQRVFFAGRSHIEDNYA